MRMTSSQRGIEGPLTETSAVPLDPPRAHFLPPAEDPDTKIAIATDEISRDLATALELGLSWGVRNFEIRGLGAGRVPDLTPAETDELLAATAAWGVNVSALSPGVFKIPLDDPRVESQITDTLPRTYDLAARLGAKIVIVFGFLMPQGAREADYPRPLLDVFHRVAEEARAAGFTLTLENEPSCWIGTGATAARVMAELNHPNLRLNWDPANSAWAGGDPYPAEYEAVRPYVAHLHIKDIVRGDPPRGVPLGEGEIDWAGQVDALRRDGYDGFWTVETHCAPKVKATHDSLQALCRLLGVRLA
jgi:sugar phosphate isomerase/epimerase